MRTPLLAKNDVNRTWYVVDAQGKTLGRLATRISRVLQGKHKPDYTPHADTGDFVVIINAGKVRLTGRKAEKKFYRWHTGYPGGLKEVAAGRMLKHRPTRVIEWSVKGMLPKGSLGRRLGMKLKVYAGPNHPHQAQKPQVMSIPA